MHKDRIEIISNFPVEQITVVDPMTGLFELTARHDRTRMQRTDRPARRRSRRTDADRFGPKAANLARLGRAGLPIPDGFCVDAEAYRVQVAALGLDGRRAQRALRGTCNGAPRRARDEARPPRSADRAGSAAIRCSMRGERSSRRPARSRWCVPRRWSRTVSDRASRDSSKATSAWRTRPTSSPPCVHAGRRSGRRACCVTWQRTMRVPRTPPWRSSFSRWCRRSVSGGGLSRTADGDMVLNATWGLGSAIAQGEVVPDRIVLSRDSEGELTLRDNVLGRKFHRVGCAHGTRPVPRALASKPCLNRAQAVELGRLLRRVEDILGMPVEIEWALDDAGFKLLQARPLHLEPAQVPDEIWLRHPGLNGHPAGVGWGSGRGVRGQLRMRARPRRAGRYPGDEGRRPGVEPGAPARSRRRGGARRQHVAPRLARAGARHSDGPRRARCHAAHPGWGADQRSTVSPASCAGCADAPRRISMRPRVFITQPVAKSAIERLRSVAEVESNPDAARIMSKDELSLRCASTTSCSACCRTASMPV